jgi:hypothetical protein
MTRALRLLISRAMVVVESASWSSRMAAHQQPARANGDVGHAGAPLVEDQVKSGAKAIPTLCSDATPQLRAADLAGDCAGGKVLL